MAGDEFEAAFSRAVVEESTARERSKTLAEEWTNLAGSEEKVPTRPKITWFDITAQYIGCNVHVVLMGLFERINPLKYEGNLKGNLFLVFEQEEWLKTVFPRTLRLACGEFSYLSHKVAGSMNVVEKLSSFAVEVCTKIPANLMEIEFCIHILYTK